MTDDVQVSNARRVGFTALAIVSFWVLAWHAYRTGAGFYYPSSVLESVASEQVRVMRFSIVGLLLALVPAVLLSLSVRNSLLPLRTPFVCLAAMLICACLGYSCWLGEHDAVSHLRDLLLGDRSRGGMPSLSNARETQSVSWPWLILPISMSTALVIAGAREAPVQASHVRGIVFTALAVLTVWILTLREYSLACNVVYRATRIGGSLGMIHVHGVGLSPHSAYLAASMALIPAVLIAVAMRNPLHRLQVLWTVTSAVVVAATILAARGLGLDVSNFDAHISDALSAAHSRAEGYDEQEMLFDIRLVDQHEARWPWLLLPLILTTAFVVFGAWRRAVRDEVER